MKLALLSLLLLCVACESQECISEPTQKVGPTGCFDLEPSLKDVHFADRRHVSLYYNEEAEIWIACSRLREPKP